MSSGNKPKELCDIDFNVLVNAIKNCYVDKLPTKSTAAAYSISRTTLQRYVKKVEEKFGDIKAVKDDALLDFVRSCNKRVPSNQIFSIAQENDLQGLEIRHLAGLICKTLDLALTPKTIKSGFRATGIMPFDADIFGEADYVKAVGQAILTPEPITSLLILDEVGPVRGSTPKKPSNRGRKPMESSELTSPNVLPGLKKKAAERDAKKAAKVAKEAAPAKCAKSTPAIPSAKRAKPTPAKHATRTLYFK